MLESFSIFRRKRDALRGSSLSQSDSARDNARPEQQERVRIEPIYTKSSEYGIVPQSDGTFTIREKEIEGELALSHEVGAVIYEAMNNQHTLEREYAAGNKQNAVFEKWAGKQMLQVRPQTQTPNAMPAHIHASMHRHCLSTLEDVAKAIGITVSWEKSPVIAFPEVHARVSEEQNFPVFLRLSNAFKTESGFNHINHNFTILGRADSQDDYICFEKLGYGWPWRLMSLRTLLDDWARELGTDMKIQKFDKQLHSRIATPGAH